MSPDTTFLYFLLLLFSLFFIIGVLVPWLARKWYVRRNGHPRKRRHANDTHRKLTFGVIAVTIFVSLFANVLQLLPALPGLIVLLGCLFIYVTGSTYLWKKESSNKDDYRYEMLVNGGSVIEAACLYWPGSYSYFESKNHVLHILPSFFTSKGGYVWLLFYFSV